MSHFMPEMKSKFRLYSTSPSETAPAMFVFVDNATFPPTHLLCIEHRRNEIASQCRGEMPVVNAKGVMRLFINHIVHYRQWHGRTFPVGGATAAYLCVFWLYLSFLTFIF